MDWYAIAFYLFAAITLISGLIVVTSKNIMHSAFALLFTLFGMAGFYAMLMADFIAITQIMIYIGGILVLLIFGVMLTSNITGVDIRGGVTGKFQIYSMYFVCGLVAVLLYVLYQNVSWVKADTQEVESTIHVIGYVLLTDYLIAFEVASVLLLIAIVGAALIARVKNTGGTK